MGKRTPEQNRLLDSLVLDCIAYNLSESLALKYIETKFGELISPPAYYARKKRIEEEGEVIGNEWLNNQTKIGFILNHKRHMEDLERIRDWAIERFFYESNQKLEKLDKEFILKLNADIRETTRYLSELNIGNPVIAKMKADNMMYEKKYNELLKRMSVPQQVTN